uniref:Zinc finger PMZ-type domain-containing protein n=1 Tax=Lactuca sativa TaxID=4236 RepID=A0A9R1UQH1_LACSA|nr:hypothetical protein LSAT_V11C800434850 [Lactuca sativa]
MKLKLRLEVDCKMSSQSSTSKYLTVDVHYSGLFAPNLLKHLDPEKITVRDVDFGGFTYKEFLLWLRNLTNGSCDNVLSYGNEEEDDNKEEDHKEEKDDSDEDDNLDDIIAYEHEVDEEVHTFNKTVGDDFLNELSVIGKISDDDEHNDGKDDKVVFPVHDENQEWDKMVPILGMKFANPMQLKLCITNYAVKNGYDLWYEKSDHNRLLVKCCKGKKNKKNKGCPFRLRATWMSNERSFQIKSLINNHNCSRVFKFRSIISYKWIGNHFMNEILQKPKMSVRKLKAKVSKTFNLVASVGQCRNARRYAFKEIKGTLKEHYAKTWSYGEDLRRTNLRSTVKMDGVKDGWIKDCRRVIGLDGCFLKGACRGQLLSAVGRDANNHIYPLAWAVVAVESKETWKWFVDLLLDDIGMENGQGLTLISDQHKGLLEAVKERAKFEQHMNKLKNIEPLAYDHLMERDPKTWSKAFFQTDRACDAYENGVSESFNSIIGAARKRPLITMLEEIRIYVMERLCRQKSKGSSWGDLNICPAIRLKLSKIKQLQRFWRVVPPGSQQFEVRLLYDAYAINLGKKTCGCRGWQLTGYPCVYAYDAISNLNRDPKEYVKVKVELVQQVDVESDSDNEVQRDPNSEVESYEVDFEECNHKYEDVDQPEVEAEVGGVEVEAHVEALVEVEVEEGEYQAAVVDQVEVEVQGQGEGQ